MQAVCKDMIKDMQTNIQNNNSSPTPQQVNNQGSEARDIKREVDSYVEEFIRLDTELDEIKVSLSNMECLLSTATSYLKEARTTPRSNKVKYSLLYNLHKAISKVKSSYASLNVCYVDATYSLEKACVIFRDTNNKADDALAEALKESKDIRYNMFSALLLDKSQPNTNKKANIVDNNEIENFLFINLFSLDFNN
ncbi:hypothetical protein QIA05_05355 (plasmid) [Borreliella burgdorferi]|uniref:hypothetical protein n=3 Tax=Borreliella burgdorferi TaxID=139 RepID=UPI00017F423B|nr:conserved hypothetical protein [Borreliella burgdorferi 64b]